MTTSYWTLTRPSTNCKKGITPINVHRITLMRQTKEDIIDIDNSISYTLLEPDTSRNFIKGLRNSISQLKYFPYKFPLVQDDILHRQGIRCMPHKNYYIFYEVIEAIQVAVVLKVVCNRRN